MSVLEVQGLAKTYGRRRVVDDVSLHVDRGEIVGLLGPNGAGKTTSFRMTCGMVEPDKGRVLLGEIDVTDWPMPRRARDGGMGYLAQESSVFRKLTVEQNLLAIMELLGIKRKARKQRADSLMQQFDITHIRKSRASKLSGGERRRLEIARCLVSDPEIIMLDEPFAGIDPVTVQSIQGTIKKLRDQGISILITDHAAREILEIVDRCYVISEGKVLCNGTPTEIRNHPEVRSKYLGDMDGSDSPPSIRDTTPRSTNVPDVDDRPLARRTRQDGPARSKTEEPNAQQDVQQDAQHGVTPHSRRTRRRAKRVERR